MSHDSAPRAAASATAVVSEPPRPSVVMSYSVETPWKPATSTIWPRSSASWMRRARTEPVGVGDRRAAELHHHRSRSGRGGGGRNGRNGFVLRRGHRQRVYEQ